MKENRISIQEAADIMGVTLTFLRRELQEESFLLVFQWHWKRKESEEHFI